MRKNAVVINVQRTVVNVLVLYVVALLVARKKMLSEVNVDVASLLVLKELLKCTMAQVIAKVSI